MLKKLRDRGFKGGFKRTPQRLAILDFLDGNTAHPSAEEIYKAVSKQYRSMSFATVYNTLNALVDAGAVRDLTIDPDRRRYDPNTQPHHHLFCVECRKVVDIPDAIPVEVPKTVSEEFLIAGSQIEFFGYCSRCTKRKRER